MIYRARFTWCYWHDQYRCECRLINRMIEGERCTVYPASSMVRIDRQLFGLVLSALSPAYVSAMMRGVERGQHKLSGLFEMQGMVCRHISLLVPLAEGMIETLWWSGQICDGHVLKIQAWWRRVVRDRQERRLALAMGLHARLGLASPLADLCDDHLRLILSA